MGLGALLWGRRGGSQDPAGGLLGWDRKWRLTGSGITGKGLRPEVMGEPEATEAEVEEAAPEAGAGRR